MLTSAVFLSPLSLKFLMDSLRFASQYFTFTSIILTCVIFKVHARVECLRQESNLVELRSRLSSDLFES